MRLRTEIVRSLSGWPVSAWYFLSVPAAQTESVGSRLSRIEEIRTVISVVGRYNIAMAVWMRTLSDVSRLEAATEWQLPDVRIADRSVVTRTTKLVGNLLDDSGRAVGYVPWRQRRRGPPRRENGDPASRSQRPHVRELRPDHGRFLFGGDRIGRPQPRASQLDHPAEHEHGSRLELGV